MASSASTEQWIFTGGSFSSLTMSVFLILAASSTVLPLSHSVARLEEAMALPQPKVLNFASSMTQVDLDLQLHDVTTLRRPHQARPHARRVLAERADIARVVVVVDDLVAICHYDLPLTRPST
jgi:hypothetical protein